MKTPEEVRRELDKVVPFKSETKRGKPGKAPHEQVARVQQPHEVVDVAAEHRESRVG